MIKNTPPKNNFIFPFSSISFIIKQSFSFTVKEPQSVFEAGRSEQKLHRYDLFISFGDRKCKKK